MSELFSPRLSTDALEGSDRDAGQLVRLVIAGDEFDTFLSGMSARRAEFVKALARPTLEKLRHWAALVAKDPAALERVPVGFRPQVRQYADTMIRRRRDRSSES